LSAFCIGDSALKAAQIAIQVTGPNVANAGDENYTRQRAILQAT
jgi:flagellar hook-associated protein FlgK